MQRKVIGRPQMTPNEWDQLTAKSEIDETDPNGKPEDRTTYYGQYGKNVT